ncbi:hypothetical protein VTN31DRAFT_7519 [Thermomyces dupontii]|uniref:uncharacterized protein n=1 Tax=Talaromyces thermophilus TaxID=28565 RepID=UPI0037423141
MALARYDVDRELGWSRNTVNSVSPEIDCADGNDLGATGIETLTAALFEEANKMVAAAKQEREAVERKNEQLRAQIRDTEMLVASQKEQLAELKGVMAEMNSCRDETDTHTNISTTPSSPAVNKHSSLRLCRW